jgi:pyruvate/2-oxoglutarate dehydrogenase complex dihydrolipoamide acyltransferase (E2) component
VTDEAKEAAEKECETAKDLSIQSIRRSPEMSAERIYMPKLGMHMTEGTVAEWLVADGDYCEQGAVLVEIETEKVTHEVEAPAAGYVHIAVQEGETVDVGSVLAEITAEPAA